MQLGVFFPKQCLHWTIGDQSGKEVCETETQRSRFRTWTNSDQFPVVLDQVHVHVQNLGPIWTSSLSRFWSRSSTWTNLDQFLVQVLAQDQFQQLDQNH